jgi:integrase
VDITFRLPNGRRHRERSKAPVASKSAAQRWGEDRERYLLQHGLPQPKKEVPTLREFWPRFIEDHAKANQQKPSGIFAKEAIGRVHLLPTFGDAPLDRITLQRVQQLKGTLSDRAPKTVNNVLSVLNTALRKAVEWGVIEALPCAIRLLPVPLRPAPFYDYDEFDRLIAATHDRGQDAYLVVLLGGQAGLRRGEIAALQWGDIEWGTGKICVQRSVWKGHLGMPKGNRIRRVPMTVELRQALQTARHLRGPFVFCRHDGQPSTEKDIGDHVDHASRAAGLKHHGIHILRHTFCSHLAMKGRSAIAIQQLARHTNLRTTLRYMHLSPNELDDTVAVLERASRRGEILETANYATAI